MKNRNIFSIILLGMIAFMLTSCSSNQTTSVASTCPCGCDMKNVCEMIDNCPMKDTCPMKDKCLVRKACQTNDMSILNEGSCKCNKDKCPLKANGCKCKQSALENSSSCKGMVMAMNDNKNKDITNISAINAASNNTKDENSEVTDYESCVRAGGLILKSLPPKCRDPKTGKIFTKKEDIIFK